MGFSCLFSLLFAGAPRLALVLLWIFLPECVEQAFETFLLPILGLLFLPIVTFVYVLIAPDRIQGLDGLWLGLTFLADAGVWAAGGYLNRRRLGMQGRGKAGAHVRRRRTVGDGRRLVGSRLPSVVGCHHYDRTRSKEEACLIL